MASFEIDGRRINSDYINARCRALLDENHFTHQSIIDMERILKYLRDRKLTHLLRFNATDNNYIAAVKVPLTRLVDGEMVEDPINVIVSAKSPCTAVALCAVRLAELAEV